MSAALSSPLVPPECDCTDLDGFMLNVERLMASELVALSSHEVVSAAMFVWCRAWKQLPAASLPDDDRVNAAFARLPLHKFKKLKDEIMRGFVKCSDGRLYHKFLAAEAIRAFEKKSAFQGRRAKDAERLRTWRESRKETRIETHNETASETLNETRFVAEGRYGTGQGRYEKKKEEDGGQAAFHDLKPPDPDAELFRRGKELLGPSAGGQIKKLKGMFAGDVAKTRALLEAAASKENPAEYVAATIKRNAGGQFQFENGVYDKGL
jgi:hypothetical protein